MKYLRRDQLVKILDGAAKLLEQHGRRIPSSKSGLQPNDALALSHMIFSKEYLKEFSDDLLETLSQSVSYGRYVEFRENHRKILDRYVENVRAAIYFYTGADRSFYRATAKKFYETAGLVKSSSNK